MSTWHQDQAMSRNKTPLWHETKWTVLESGPGVAMAVTRFDTVEEAQTYERKIGSKHSSILPPMQYQMARRARGV